MRGSPGDVGCLRVGRAAQFANGDEDAQHPPEARRSDADDALRARAGGVARCASAARWDERMGGDVSAACHAACRDGGDGDAAARAHERQSVTRGDFL
jgi:hypothetical protein